MKSLKAITWVVAAVSFALFGAASIASAQTNSSRSPEFSLMGGVQLLSENDTALPDQFLNVPVVANITYPLTENWAFEGDFSWMIPIQQNVDMGSGTSQDRKSPDILSYQAGVRASLPLTSWTPYLAAGAGAVTFLSNTDADRVPQLDQSQTAFAINFGTGAIYNLAQRWALRADVRELVAFPSNDASGLSTDGNADPIWMGRAVVGFGYRF